MFATSASPAGSLEVSKIEYDGLGRAIRAEDVDGNQVFTEYDQNSNVVRTTLVEKHPTSRVPDETFVSLNVSSANTIRLAARSKKRKTEKPCRLIGPRPAIPWI